MKYSIGSVVGLALLGGALAMGVATQNDGKLAPGVQVGGVDVGGLTSEQAVARLQEKNPAPQVTIKAADKTWTVGADQLGWQLKAAESLADAEKYTAERSFLERLQGAVGRAATQEYPLQTVVDAGAAKTTIAKLTTGLATEPKSGSVGFDNKTLKYVVIKPDVPGRKADAEGAAKLYAADPSLTSLNVPITTWRANSTTEKLQALADLGNKLMRPMTVKLASTNRVGNLSALQLANLYWVRPEGIVLDEKTITSAFKSVASQIGEPARNARYTWTGGKYVKTAEKAGEVVDETAGLAAFKKAITDPAVKTMILPSKVSEPGLTLASLPDPASMKLIATGISTYYHSSPERRTNVANAAAKIDGAVVPAGEVFSFLNSLGGITPGNGFVGGLIISGGRTVDGLGGGVCQVSTTTFRAMYQAGLPVVERNQHSYRVGYYEPQVGFEAAVYDPGVDLKFKNDTGGPIMIKTTNYPRASKLVVEVWGTVKPQRSVYVSPAVILSRTPHPPAKYVVSAKLRPGQINQVDWAQDGYNLYITRTIKDGQGTRVDRTSTWYKPWQAVYEVGPGTRS